MIKSESVFYFCQKLILIFASFLLFLPITNHCEEITNNESRETQKHTVHEDTESDISDIQNEYNLPQDSKYQYYTLFDFHKEYPLCSDKSIELLTSLQERYLTITHDEEKLFLFKKSLYESIEKLEKKYQDILDITQKFEKLIEIDKGLLDEKISKLAKVYSDMEPRDVSKIFNELDIEVLLPIIKKMKESDITEIFASMKVNKVKTITLELMKDNFSQLGKQNSME